MTVSTSGARHLLFRLAPPARLPDAMLDALRDEVVLAGWVRASGVLSDVQIRVVDATQRNGETASLPRRIAGPVQLVILEGSVGLAAGDVSCGLRVVISRETDSGAIETIAGDLVEARVNALEVLVIAFDDVTATRQLDASGVWLLDATAGVGAAPAAPLSPPARVIAPAPFSPPPAPLAPVAVPLQSGFSSVVRANAAEAQPILAPLSYPPAAPAARPSPTFSSNSNAMPARILKPIGPEEEDQAIPEPGDVVEHFAFGRCEVVKTDGDRLHVRLPKDQRVKEIALEMLRVSMLEPEDGQTTNHWKLSRKL